MELESDPYGKRKDKTKAHLHPSLDVAFYFSSLDSPWQFQTVSSPEGSQNISENVLQPHLWAHKCETICPRLEKIIIQQKKRTLKLYNDTSVLLERNCFGTQNQKSTTRTKFLHKHIAVCFNRPLALTFFFSRFFLRIHQTWKRKNVIILPPKPNLVAGILIW